MIPELNEDRKIALKQWRALYQLCCSQEKRLISHAKKIKQLEKQLAKTSKSEIDALYATNERLTDLLEEQRLTIEALLMGCKERGIEGSTAVLTYIARLEDELNEARN